MAALVFSHPFAAVVAPFFVSAIAYKHFHWKKASKCEVFLSFSGEDAPKNFADGLCKGMVDAGICVLRSDYWLRQDGKIKFQAIKSSKISIPILCPKYDSSRRCLNELVQIMECKNDSSGHVVLPIFYRVKPTDVSCKIDGCDPKVVKKWEQALSSLKECKSENIAGGEGGQLVKLVVRKVLIELKKALEIVIADNPIGIESPVKEIMQFLDQRHVSTAYVGIHGESGVGKTTLAKVIYNKLSSRFAYCSFIADISESCECNGMKHLQKQLIRDILKLENVQDEKIGTIISSEFKDKKVLILLDDMDANHQLEALVGERNWFASGSRIIVTTKNRSVLDWAKVDFPYEHIEMDINEAKILFARHAFRRNSPPSEFSNLFDHVVSTIRRFPLTLEVVGSYLCGKSQETWENITEKFAELREFQESRKLQELRKLKELEESQELQELLKSQELRQLQRLRQLQQLQEWQESQELQELHELQELQELQQQQKSQQLQELQKLPQMEVQEILKIVYDKLKDEQQKFFLDIACVLVGSDARIASYVWDTSDYQVLGIEELRFMSLIKIGDNNELRMHNQLRDLGRRIDWERSCNKPGYGRRLWDYDEAFKVLDGNPRTKNIRALSLNKNNSNLGQNYTDGQFKNLVGLQFLRMSDASFRGDFGSTFSKLRWFQWERCPQDLEKNNFGMEELAVLDLSGSMIRRDWKGWNPIMSAKQLKVLNLTGCNSLERTISLSAFESLEILILRNCEKLKEIHPSCGDLKTLVFLDLSGCSSLKMLPKELGKLEELKELLLDRTKIREIPSLICSLKKLEMISAKKCEFYFPLPNNIGSLVKLRCLSLQSCGELRLIPDSICELKSLVELVLANTKIKKLPESIGNLQNLEILNINSTDIEELPNAIGRLRKLRELNALKCENLSEVISSIRDLCSLQRLNLIGCLKLEFLSELPSNLIVVGVTCKSKTLPSFSHLTHLKQLRLHYCVSLERIPDLPSTLLELEVLGCGKVQFLTPLKSLERLDIICCKFEGQLDLSKFNQLRVFYARNCRNIQEIRGLNRLKDLKSLTIQGHPPIELDEPFFAR